MSNSLQDQTIALAGAYQAINLVHLIANTGNYNADDFEHCIFSIFQINIDKVEDAYGGISNVRSGLKVLIDQLGGNNGINKQQAQQEAYITKYMIGAMVLEKQLSNDPVMLGKVSSGIVRAREQANHFSITHENVIANLASLYTQTISTLKPRIMVHGEQVYLSNPTQTNRIRALLLAAIRSIVLWKQCNGSRWGLLIRRRHFIGLAKMVLGE